MKILAIFLISFSLVMAADRRQMLAAAERMKTDERITYLEKVSASDGTLRPALAAAFLQKLRETGDIAYLNKASTVLDKAPASLQAERLRLQIEMQLHHFPVVSEKAFALLQKEPSDATTLGLLGDSLMELGRYKEAGDAYHRMAALGGNLFSFNRLAYYEFVTGHAENALGWMAQAIAAGSGAPENQAWCLSEMGDMLLKTGRSADAEQAYLWALKVFPGYHRANAGLGRLLSAKGDVPGAIEHLKAAQSVVPLPEYAGQLEALLAKTGDREGANRQRALLETIEKLASANGETANRTLALIYADAGRNLDRALALAKAEFAVRDDVYSYDALSWVLFKLNRMEEARQASDRAMALNTPEPMFREHAKAIREASTSRGESGGTLVSSRQ